MDSQKSKSKKTKKVPATRRKPANASCLAPGEWFEKLVALQARLRAPNGCPWDHERSEEHTSELQSRSDLVCRLLLEKKKQSSGPSSSHLHSSSSDCAQTP